MLDPGLSTGKRMVRDVTCRDGQCSPLGDRHKRQRVCQGISGENNTRKGAEAPKRTVSSMEVN